jgi:hypothetical protein
MNEEATMKSLKTVISSLGILFIVFCSQAAVAQKSGNGNSIPYPLDEWKGVQGKSLKDSTPYFIGPHK